MAAIPVISCARAEIGSRAPHWWNGACFGSLPYERQVDGARAFTPWPLVNIPQPLFEQFLSQRLSQGGDTSLLRGLTAAHCGASDDGVVTTLLMRPDGHICASWKKAPEDASATLRHSLNKALGY